jgi:hypothetical protein
MRPVVRSGNTTTLFYIVKNKKQEKLNKIGENYVVI